MRIHRDTCAGIELVVTAHTKVGIRYKVGFATLAIETLTHVGPLAPALLPIYRMRKGPFHDSSFAIGEMHVDFVNRPFAAPPANPTPSL
jgi:hypothetical protein